VDGRSLQMLEYARIVERVAAETSFDGGRLLAESLAPSADVAAVRRLQAETTEALRLLEAGAPRLAGAHDVRRAADAAARGAILQPDALAAIAETCRCAVDARGLLADREDAPLLRVIAAAITPSLATLADRIEAAVEADGSRLRDGASPSLRRLRRETAQARGRAVERLRALAGSLRPHLQEDFVTERAGRPVLAVKASARSAVPGIVHDSSGSGQTLFVEPFAIVEAQNAIRELEAAEREEVERILAELSAFVRVAAPAIVAAVGALAHLDLTLARAAVSRRWGGCPVEIGDDVSLVEARHPLLDPASAVPIDLPLAGVRGVVISGPNTGGKTVGLKTLGILALAHQSGLRPPARTARLPVFDAVLADIGDEQSIAMSLSTFSGHVRNLVRILDAAGTRSLVLLDEVAAGTDPHEGAALARSYLQRLLEGGALVLATTHYPELKEWASATAGVVNAAVGFDPDTLAPTYLVTFGRPGASHALQIAERLGLESAVVDRARAEIEPTRLAVADLLAEAAGAERDAAASLRAADVARREATAALEDARRRERELAEALEAVRAGAQAERERARAEAERRLGDYNRELDGLRAEIRDARREEGRRRDANSAAADDALRERDRRLDAASKRTRRAAAVLSETLVEQPVPMTRPLAVGDPVVALSLGVRGTIVAIEGDHAEVHGGTLRIRVPVDRLTPDPRGARRASEPESPVVVRAAAPSGVAYSIDVRGKTGDEAREEVRLFVDQAHLSGRDEVEIIHGRGTGAVRKAVRDELAKHPLVEGSRSQSADGATVVTIAGGSRG
jgi:DNA mismatch repair protein MutS2